MQSLSTSSCSDWETDPQSFSKIIAEHYVRTELGSSLRGQNIWCRPDGKWCIVRFPGDIEVAVSLVKVPDYVIARQFGQAKPRREYNYLCTPQGNVILRQRRQKSRTLRRGRRASMYLQTRDGLGQEVPLLKDLQEVPLLKDLKEKLKKEEEEKLLRRRDEFDLERLINRALREPKSSQRSKKLSQAFNSVPVWYAPKLYTRLRTRRKNDSLSKGFHRLATSTRARMLQILMDKIVKNCDCTGKQ